MRRLPGLDDGGNYAENRRVEIKLLVGDEEEGASDDVTNVAARVEKRTETRVTEAQATTTHARVKPPTPMADSASLQGAPMAPSPDVGVNDAAEEVVALGLPETADDAVTAVEAVEAADREPSVVDAEPLEAAEQGLSMGPAAAEAPPTAEEATAEEAEVDDGRAEDP